ncbi:hypothetical protein [Paenibacillus sp. Y412MC10]|uniref:hypothetical protein n=1 Tax=Geobacillus sp. (strain Y412MC10) TaxID=481743 RepID=UPI0037C9E60A
MAGDAKIDNSKYKAHFRNKAVMIKIDQSDEITGHQPGGVCPFEKTSKNIWMYL